MVAILWTPAVVLRPKTVNGKQITMLVFVLSQGSVVSFAAVLHKGRRPLKVEHQIIELPCVRVAKVTSQGHEQLHQD